MRDIVYSQTDVSFISWPKQPLKATAVGVESDLHDRWGPHGRVCLRLTDRGQRTCEGLTDRCEPDHRDSESEEVEEMPGYDETENQVHSLAQNAAYL